MNDIFYPFIAICKAVECPQDMLIPAITYSIAAVNIFLF